MKNQESLIRCVKCNCVLVLDVTEINNETIFVCPICGIENAVTRAIRKRRINDKRGS
jgi:predicted RNA-binding Zn-ribbon protein involved in translation (DUF1610 family)